MLSFRFAATAALASLALVAPATATAQDAAPAAPALTAAPYDDAGYWAFADRMQLRLDGLWDEGDGYYRGGGGGADPMTNSMLLLTHSVAALSGHEGPARNDRRARRLAERLVTGAPYITSNTGTGQKHAPGFVNSMSSAQGGQHLVFDAEVIDGLTYAFKARSGAGAAGLDGGQAARRDLTHRAREVLALPDDPAEPDQLVRADVRRRPHGHRRPDAAQARPARAAAALRARRPGRTSGRACASTTSRTSGSTTR